MKKIGWIAIILFGLLCSLFQQVHAAEEPSYTAKVVADSLNVRSEPSIDATVQGSLHDGDLVSVSKEDHGWLLVTSKHFDGWVAGYYLKKVDGDVTTNTAKVKADPNAQTLTKTKPSARQGVVRADSLRIRSGPGLKYSVQSGVKEGDVLYVLDSKNNWLQIRTAGGTEGWVSGEYIEARRADSGHVHSNGLQGKRIVIDPGHGGNDPGMIGAEFETLEKDLNLSTSLYLADILRARGAEVILTRTKDEDKPSLSKRVEISESSKADAFVSIHYNSAKNAATGTLTFYNKEDMDIPLAKAIEARLSEGTGLRSNGYAFGDYHVLRENDRPSALVELGFLTNAKDEKRVRTADYQKKAAEAIADGLEDYFHN